MILANEKRRNLRLLTAVLCAQARKVAWLPNVVFGALCLIAAIFTLLLPETLGRPLPQTIEEVEQWTRTLR